jgi:hypothetical protein
MCDTPLREMAKECDPIFKLLLFRHFLRAHRAATWSFILSLVLALSLQAQERVRTAEGPPLIAAYARSPEAFFYFGPFQEVLEGTASVQYTDNVDLTATNKISDLSFTEGLALNTTWVISHLNQLEFNFGGQVIEHFYGNGRSQLNLAVAPNSKIEFKFDVSDFRFRIYDSFSYSQNPTTDPTATNTANLNSLTNTIGAAVDADLNIAVFTLGADYTYNNQSGTNSQGQDTANTTGERQSFRVGPSLTFRLSPEIVYGVNIEATRSTGAGAANVNSLSFGPFMKGKLTRDFEFDVTGGGTIVDTKPAIPPGYFFSADIRYKVTRHWQVLFSASHDLIFTTGTGLTEENLVKLGTQLGLTRNTTISFSPFVNFGDVKTTGVNSGGVAAGSYTQIGLEAGFGWTPRKRWTTSLTYDYLRRESGAGAASANNSYIQNTFSLSIGYSF